MPTTGDAHGQAPFYPGRAGRRSGSGSGAEVLSKYIAAIAGGKFQISVHAAGELMPAFGVVDALRQGSIECSHTASYYFVGARPALGSCHAGLVPASSSSGDAATGLRIKSAMTKL